jgi:tight adherence protein C
MSAVLPVALAFLAAALACVGLASLVPARGSRLRRARGRRAELTLLRLASAGRLLRQGRARAPRDLEARIAAAGAPAGLGPRELMAAKTAATVGGAAVGLPLAAAAPGRLGPVVMACVPIAGFLAPDLWLRRMAMARARRVRRDLPALLDLLRVSVEAGGSLPTALLEVGSRAEGPLAAEWRAIGHQVALGVPLERALARMVERLPLTEVRGLVGALERARRHGAPLAETLAAQARDARFALARRVREDAARAGPKIQLVVALLLVPSVLLLVAAALASALLESGGPVLPI